MSTAAVVHNLRQCEQWIFDMDGTLTCSIHDFDDIRRQLSLPSGEPILESIAKLPKPEADALHRELHRLEMDLAFQATAQPGAAELLEHLVENKRNVGIVTRNGKDIAHATLEACGLGRFFEPLDVITRDCCAAKPDPAGVNQLVNRWGHDPALTVMVGDYLFDLQAGHSAGTHTIHMAVDNRGSWPELTSLRVDSLHDVFELLTADT